MSIIPPRSFHEDTVGLFSALFLLGVTQLLTSPSPSVERAVSFEVGLLWSGTLAVFGLLGLVSAVLSNRQAVRAAGLHVAARVGCAFGCAAYAAALLLVGSPGRASYGLGLAFLVLAVTNGLAARKVVLWVRIQRVAVAALLHRQDEEHGSDG